MKIKLFVLFLMLASVSLLAEFKSNPNPETLWSEDGKAIETGDNSKSWCNKAISIESLPEGGFSLSGSGTKPSPLGYRQVSCSPEYPWLTFQITKVFNNPGKYRSWGVHLLGAKIGQSTEAYTGFYNINCYMNNDHPDTGKKVNNIRFYLYNMGLHIADIKMVKKPDYFVDTIIKDGKIKFTAYLKEPAEDVSVSLYHSRHQIPVNGQNKLQLKPVDKDFKVWGAEFEIKQPLATKQKSSFKKYDLVVRASILGGEIFEPVWTSVNYPYPEENKEQ